MSRRSKIGVTLKPVPIPRALVRAQSAGEVVHACGGSDDEVDISQRGIARGLIQTVTVIGTDAAGRAADKVELTFSGDADGDIALDLDGGNRSATEALDAGLGHAVAHVAERMRRNGLTPEVYFAFTPELYADPERLAAAREELGIGPATLPTWPDGSKEQEILRIKPAKDNGFLATFYTRFKK